MNLHRPVPLWLFLVGLLTVSSVAAGLTFLPALLVPKDFTVSLSPSQQTVIAEPGQVSGSQVNVRSLHGFIGRVSLKAVAPSSVNVSFSGVGGSSWDVLLGSDNALLGINATVFMNVSAAATGNFSITVVGTSGSLSHAAALRLIAQDVVFRLSPPSLTLQQGSSLVTRLSLTSLNGFTGNVSLNAVNNFPWYYQDTFKVALGPASIIVPPRTTVTRNVNVSAGEFNPPGSGYVSVHATFESQSWVAAILVQILQAPEPLTITSYVFNSNSNATLWIRNDGPLRVLINRYNVTDGLGNSYNWCLSTCGAAPLFQINSTSVRGFNVLVGSNCPVTVYRRDCYVYGSQFTFQTGHSYNVNVWTTRNNTLTFTIRL